MDQIKPSLHRKFLPERLNFTWESIQLYYQNLLDRTLSSKDDLHQWLVDKSELEAVLSEEFAWRYIRMNIDTQNKTFAEEFQFFVKEINPKIAPIDNQLNHILNDCPYKKELDQDLFKIALKSNENQIALFREENIPLFTQLEEDSQKYGAISAGLSIHYKGKELTLQQGANFLKDSNRTVRKEVFDLINEERLKVVHELDLLFNDLIKLRHQVALNAGFENYRDYMFKAMDRFDYSPEDCFKFHESIKNHLVPALDFIAEKRMQLLGINDLRPWDTSVDIEGKPALKPFKDGEELLEKTINCFNKIDPFFGECLIQMKNKNHLDLESKKGKAPGGFNYPLYESGLPFIYMNAVGSFRDVTTMVHEGGHAIHSVLSHPLELIEFKRVTSEIAELASMSMELISMDYWDVFYEKPEDLKRAKRDQLLDVLSTLPWIATIDKFQHWIYLNPNHRVAERSIEWTRILNEFSGSKVNWDSYEKSRENMWQKQLHLYEVPFYYIEYGMAQLGAIAIWKNYRENPKKTIEQYKSALSLGYTKSISEIYEAAGISFNFSDQYVAELAGFIIQEIKDTF